MAYPEIEKVARGHYRMAHFDIRKQVGPDYIVRWVVSQDEIEFDPPHATFLHAVQWTHRHLQLN